MTKIIKNITTDCHVLATETDVLIYVSGNVTISACQASETSGNELEVVVVSGVASIGGALPSGIILTGGSGKYNSNGSAWQTINKTEAEGSENFDTINEKTAGAGVTVDGTLIKDGAISTALNGGTILLAKANIDTGEIKPSLLTTPEGTPVNAVAANKLLTIGTNPVEAATVSVGGKTYKFRAVIGAGAKATGLLTFNTELPHANDTVILGLQTYKFVAALSAGPTVPNEILIEATVTLTIDNLVSAVMGTAGVGVKYSVGTASYSSVITVTKASADTFAVEYNAIGFLGNSFDTLGTLTHATWGANALAGGIDVQAANDVLIGISVEASIDNLVLAITAGAGIGVNYGTGTTVNTLATAVKASVATMTATNKIKGVIGNATAIDEDLADGSWALDVKFLSGGIDGTVGVANEIRQNATDFFVCIAANTIADANWRKMSLGSAY